MAMRDQKEVEKELNRLYSLVNFYEKTDECFLTIPSVVGKFSIEQKEISVAIHTLRWVIRDGRNLLPFSDRVMLLRSLLSMER
jgi:hypothetical protein